MWRGDAVKVLRPDIEVRRTVEFIPSYDDNDFTQTSDLRLNGSAITNARMRLGGGVKARYGN
jgi:hypothetical protein